MLVKKTHPLPIEFVVRGYLTGSAWNSYKKDRSCCGVLLADGLNEFDEFPEPIFTPATKVDSGHDENISYSEMSNIIGTDLSVKLRDISIKLFEYAHSKLLSKGIILADTKFEFGLDESGNVLLIDEALTPDSSRFWSLQDYQKGKLITNFDKQILRDYLLSTSWDRNSQPPDLPADILIKTYERYEQIYNILVSP
jgi:phosphoribosylaminoimidazole-succinocarboxamide synthase